MFPVGEGSAVGLLFACGNFFGFLWGLILSVIVQGQNKFQTGMGLVFCFGIFLIGFALTYFMKEEKNRERAEFESLSLRKSMNRANTGQTDSDNESIKEVLLMKGSDNEMEKNIQNSDL